MRKLNISHFKLIHKINVLFPVQDPGFDAKSRLMKANDFRNRVHMSADVWALNRDVSAPRDREGGTPRPTTEGTE